MLLVPPPNAETDTVFTTAPLDCFKALASPFVIQHRDVSIHRQLPRNAKLPKLLAMTHWLENPLHHLQLGEALIANGVDAMARGWQASTEVIGKICTGGADRWQAAIRQIQTTVNLADVLRARTLL